MNGESSDDERRWAAEKRDFVADRRDDLAAEREAAGDARELLADEREADLNERERLLNSHAATLGLDPSEPLEQRVAAQEAREQARQRRDDKRADREKAESARDEATRRRLAGAPTTQLAAAFATIAEYLYAAVSLDAVLLRIAESAVIAVAGCDMASVTISEDGKYRTAATTNPSASAVDQAQYDAHEGPSLDAVETPMVYAQAFPDGRWPTLASRPAELGAQSAASYQLAGKSLSDVDGGGALNTYASEEDGFSAEAQQIGLILAVHASMAAGTVREREALEHLAENLNQALLSRDVIGQAKGILMERLKLAPEEAFDALREASMRLNEKLHQVALAVAETGEFDMAFARPSDSSEHS